MRYSPWLSVTAVLEPAISAGLLASTVTPGSTAPDVSLTTPVMLLWAHAAAGSRNRHTATSRAIRWTRIYRSSLENEPVPAGPRRGTRPTSSGWR